MNRRQLFRTIFGASAGLLATPLLAQPAAQTLLIQTSPLAGFQFHQGEALWPQLRISDPLTLVREADNRYDPRAVRIDWRGCKLGYVPRGENTAVAQLLDRGASLQARITALHAARNPWQRICFSVQVL